MTAHTERLLTNEDWLEIEREYCRRSLLNFVQQAWHVLEPSQPLLLGKPIEAIAAHLEAVSSGDIQHLLINVPPGCMKSMLTRVFWPLWEWLHRPDMRVIGASYADTLSLRDNRRVRSLLLSNWFQALFGDKVHLSDDQTAKGRFENTATGWMMATTVRGVGTGERGNRFIIDDPHNVLKSESDADRTETVRWFGETVPTRLNNMDRDSIVVIMQRLHESDVSGHILEHELPYVHLCLPMEYEHDHPYIGSSRPDIYADWRTTDGELLWPERFSREVVEQLKVAFRAAGGTYAEAGQLQQRPAPRTGGVFQVDTCAVVPWLENEEPVHTIRYWDKAGTEGGGAYTAGVKMAITNKGRFVVLDVVRGQWSPGKREDVIKTTAKSDGTGTVVWVEQEPGSGGKESALNSVRMLAGYEVFRDRVTGDKVTRAMPYAAQMEIGNVTLIQGQWVHAFVEEHRTFPNGKYKDQCDAAAGAFAKLSAKLHNTSELGGVATSAQPLRIPG